MDEKTKLANVPLQSTNSSFMFGLNLLNELFDKAFNELKCDSMNCFAYNVNLDFVSSLFEKYTSLSDIVIYSNTDKIYICQLQEKILNLINEKKIQFHHISENSITVHSKLYLFSKNGKFAFGAIGSPNFTNNSNQSLESLIYFFDATIISNIWKQVCDTLDLYEVKYTSAIPPHLLDNHKQDSKIDDRFLVGLWEHQKAIISWMADRNNSVINIPTGCGKTRLAIQYLKHLFSSNENITAIVLVPKIVLIKQWLDILSKEGIECFELGTKLDRNGEYFADPENKVLVTLYSRFNDQYLQIISKLKILKPDILLIGDECHNFYENLSTLSDFNSTLKEKGIKLFNVGLSATIDTFDSKKIENYIDLMGGEVNRYEITLQSFYSHWNNVNPLPSLKPINYVPLKYYLSEDEMHEYNELTKKVGMQSNFVGITGDSDFSAAIKRAMWVRNLKGGLDVLKKFIQNNIASFNEHNNLIFVQTSAVAEEIRDYLTSTYGWNEFSSAYVYDSKHSDKHLEYALEQFKQNTGFCLISVFMLSEGFDIPKISRVILHGSRKSNRDWLQKIGRAIRYDHENPNSVAEIADVVFCSPDGEPLPIEKERYTILSSISL